MDGNPKGARNDAVIKDAFQYGLIEETGFLYVSIKGDECEIKMIGSKDGTIFYHDKIKRTGTGKKYHKPTVLPVSLTVGKNIYVRKTAEYCSGTFTPPLWARRTTIGEWSSLWHLI